MRHFSFWLFISFSLSHSLLATCTKQREEDLYLGYNAPSRQSDFYIGAEFLYWRASQDDMELGSLLESGATIFFDTTSETTAKIIEHNFAYKPGFKILAGVDLDLDAWSFLTEYTWFFSQTQSSKNAGEDTLTTDVGITPSRGSGWMLQQISEQEGGPAGGSAAVFNKAHQTWTLFLQSLDVSISRYYHLGKQLTFQTFLGAKLDWITEKNKQTFFSNGMLSQSGGVEAIYVMQQNYSLWGAGISSGLKTRWILGKDFDLIGNSLVDLLYVYVPSLEAKFSWRENERTAPAIFKFSEGRSNFLLPHALLEFGFAWNCLFNPSQSRLDLAATYSFQVFWGANIFRDFPSAQISLSRSSDSNLYIQGLNLSGSFSF